MSSRRDRHTQTTVMNNWEGPLHNLVFLDLWDISLWNEPEPLGTTKWYPYSPNLKQGNDNPIGMIHCCTVFACYTLQILRRG